MVWTVRVITQERRPVAIQARLQDSATISATLALFLSTMKMLRIVTLLSALIPVVSAGKSTAFVYGNDLSCSNGLDVSVSSLDCDSGSNLCELGDRLSASGTMSFSSAPPEKAVMTLEVCVLNVFCKTYSEPLSFCDDLSLEGTNGEECPSAGDYTFSADFKVPGKSRYIMSGYSVSVTTTIQDYSDGSVYSVCENSISTQANYTATWTGAFVGAALLVAGVTACMARRRKTAVIDLASEEERAISGNFEMMSDTGVTV